MTTSRVPALLILAVVWCTLAAAGGTTRTTVSVVHATCSSSCYLRVCEQRCTHPICTEFMGITGGAFTLPQFDTAECALFQDLVFRLVSSGTGASCMNDLSNLFCPWAIYSAAKFDVVSPGCQGQMDALCWRDCSDVQNSTGCFNNGLSDCDPFLLNGNELCVPLVGMNNPCQPSDCPSSQMCFPEQNTPGSPTFCFDPVNAGNGTGGQGGICANNGPCVTGTCFPDTGVQSGVYCFCGGSQATHSGTYCENPINAAPPMHHRIDTFGTFIVVLGIGLASSLLLLGGEHFSF